MLGAVHGTAHGTVLGGTAGDGWGRAAAYDAYADGLHTYALWYLHDHDAAADAVYCAFVAADRNHTNLQQPEQIQPWLYALLRHECRLRASSASDAPKPVSTRLRPKPDALGESGVAASLIQLEGNLRRAEFHSLAWPEAEGLTPAHREVLELTIRHGLDSRGLALVLGLREGAAGLAPTRGFGLLADAWRELERSLAAVAVAASGRDNCAQLAELTFGWSGKLGATLRAPLTDHVDRCSRCQHYLHTVIGTPSAPTMLPYVAAPRALRDLLLGELADVDAAADAGVDLLALGARCGSFGPTGFPARFVEPSQNSTAAATAGAGRGPRRRQSGSARAGRQQAAQQAAAPKSAGPATVGFTATAAGTAILSGSSGNGSGTTPSRTIGFTATAAGTAILGGTIGSAPVRESVTVSVTDDGPTGDAPESATTSRPVRSAPTERQTATSAVAPSVEPASAPAAVQAPRPAPMPTSSMRRRPPTATPTTDPNLPQRQGPRPRARVPEADELFRAKGSWADRVLPPQGSDPKDAVSVSAGVSHRGELWRPEPEPAFVHTASGRFATRPPARPRPAGPTSSPSAPAFTAPGNARLPRYAKSKSGKGSAAGASGARARHKARPMRQAVVSAMALGAIGAVAAAAAAMLGVTSSPQNSAALDGSQSGSGIPLGSAGTGSTKGALPDQLTVSVSGGSQNGTALSGLGSGLQPTTFPASPGTTGAGSPTPTTASSGAFFVSVNQRAADPDSVQILLRNAGTAPLSWSATPSASWLTLSQHSGTLAAGQSIVVMATASSSAPSGQWSAQIVFSPGGIVVTLHGGIPASNSSSSPTSGGGGSTSSSPTTPSSPTPTATSQSPTATSTPSATATATASATTTTTASQSTSSSSTGTSTSTASPGGGGASSAPAKTAPHQPVRSR